MARFPIVDLDGDPPPSTDPPQVGPAARVLITLALGATAADLTEARTVAEALPLDQLAQILTALDDARTVLLTVRGRAVHAALREG